MVKNLLLLLFVCFLGQGLTAAAGYGDGGDDALTDGMVTLQISAEESPMDSSGVGSSAVSSSGFFSCDEEDRAAEKIEQDVPASDDAASCSSFCSCAGSDEDDQARIQRVLAAWVEPCAIAFSEKAAAEEDELTAWYAKRREANVQADLLERAAAAGDPRVGQPILISPIRRNSSRSKSYVIGEKVRENINRLVMMLIEMQEACNAVEAALKAIRHYELFADTHEKWLVAKQAFESARKNYKIARQCICTYAFECIKESHWAFIKYLLQQGKVVQCCFIDETKWGYEKNTLLTKARACGVAEDCAYVLQEFPLLAVPDILRHLKK